MVISYDCGGPDPEILGGGGPKRQVLRIFDLTSIKDLGGGGGGGGLMTPGPGFFVCFLAVSTPEVS